MKYATGGAFRTALEVRLGTRSRESGLGLNRLRKEVVFQRLLARLLIAAPGRWVLKGGLALDFRLTDRARTTKDMDLARQDDEEGATEDFLAAQALDLGDHFVYDIERIGADEAQGVGRTVRFRVVVTLGARLFESVLVDVGFGDLPVLAPDMIVAPDLLGFADIPPVRVPTLPLARHIAEKVHAYTRGYGVSDGRPSSRVKDLVDLALLAETQQFRAGELQIALNETFARRATHGLPAALPLPPTSWDRQYRKIASELDIEPAVGAGHARAAALVNPLLAGGLNPSATWDPAGGWRDGP